MLKNANTCNIQTFKLLSVRHRIRYVIAYLSTRFLMARCNMNTFVHTYYSSRYLARFGSSEAFVAEILDKLLEWETTSRILSSRIVGDTEKD